VSGARGATRRAGLPAALVAAALLSVATAFPTVARAQDPSTAAQRVRADSIRADSVLDARTTALSAELRCAVCQGISIQESPSALAQEMRAVVKDQLRAGRTPDEVKDYFVSKYGEWILLQPRAHGLNLVLLYLAPALLLLGGAALLVFVVRRWTTAAPGQTPAE